MQELLKDLVSRRKAAMAMGGPGKIARHHQQRQAHRARARRACYSILVPFRRFGLLATHHGPKAR